MTVFEHKKLLFAKGHGKIDMLPSFLLWSINLQNIRNWNVATMHVKILYNQVLDLSRAKMTAIFLFREFKKSERSNKQRLSSTFIKISTNQY